MRRTGDRGGGATYAAPAFVRDEELLETGPAHLGRRTGRLSTALVLLGCALVAVLVAAHAGGTKRHVAAPVGPTAAPAPRPFPVPDHGSPPALMLGSTLYLIRDGALIAHRAGTIAETSVTVGDPSASGGTYLLAADASRSRVWVVESLPARILVYEFAVPALREVRALHIEGQIAGVDELNGELYLSASAGVVGIGSRRSGLLDWTPLRGGRAIAADSLRNRLLLLDQDGPSARIRAESPDLTRPGTTSAALPFVTGSFMIVGGRIWAGGSGTHGAVLVRLDPRTLRPIRHSDVEHLLGSGTAFAAAGAHSFLVRAAAADARAGAGLWCVDADTGKVLQSWRSVPGPVVVDDGSGPATNRIYYVPTGSSPVELAAGACRG